MTLYYKELSFPCIWKSQMKDDMWYSMEPVKFRITIPLNIYNEILKDIKNYKDDRYIGDDTFIFKLQDGNELYEIYSVLYRSSILSRFPNGEVTVLFNISIYEKELKEKSILRDLILNQLV